MLNALGDAESVPEDQTLRPQSSGAVCTGNADCEAENERCASFRAAGVAEVENFCVQAGDENVGDACGALGRRGGVAFMVQCWDTPANGEVAVAPAEVDVAAMLSGLEGLINKTDENWDGLDDLVVSPRFNWQDGWYTFSADGDNAGKWVENDMAPTTDATSIPNAQSVIPKESNLRPTIPPGTALQLTAALCIQI